MRTLWILLLAAASFGLMSCLGIYNEYERSKNASEAKTAISSIWQATQVFYQDRGEWPVSVKALTDAKYLDLADATEQHWTFTFTGAPPEEIVATSTDLMRDGAGKEIRFNVKEGFWTGYGLPDPDVK